jgi:hypothetical protein
MKLRLAALLVLVFTCFQAQPKSSGALGGHLDHGGTALARDAPWRPNPPRCARGRRNPQALGASTIRPCA